MKKFIFAMAFLISQVPNVSMAQSEDYQNHVKQLKDNFQMGSSGLKEKAYHELGQLRELEKMMPEAQRIYDLGLSVYHVYHRELLEEFIKHGTPEQKQEATKALKWQKENQNKG